MPDMTDPELQRAVRILADILYSANETHSLAAREVEEEAAEFDISVNLLRRAQKVLKVTSGKAKGVSDGPWIWSLPADYEPPKPVGSLREQKSTERPWTELTTPCWDCGVMISNPQKEAADGDRTAQTYYRLCDDCRTKRSDAGREKLEYALETAEHELVRITAPGFTPGDPRAIELEQKIAMLRKKLGKEKTGV